MHPNADINMSHPSGRNATDAHPASDPARSGAQTSPPTNSRKSDEWSPRQHFLFLMLWWAIIVVYYVAFTSPMLRNSKDWLTLDMIYAARYPVLAAGVLGAISAERHRPLWFGISAAGAFVVLLLALILMGAIRSALGS
jgi:hypothetical protein